MTKIRARVNVMDVCRTERVLNAHCTLLITKQQLLTIMLQNTLNKDINKQQIIIIIIQTHQHVHVYEYSQVKYTSTHSPCGVTKPIILINIKHTHQSKTIIYN